MPDLDHVSRPSSSKHVSAVRPAVPSRAFPEKLPCTRRRPGLVEQSTRLRDRFVPQRSYSGNAVAKYRVRKLPMELAAHEKLLRQREKGENPFGRPHQRTAASGVQSNIKYLFQPPHMSPHLLDSEVNPRQYSTSGQRVTPRQVSVGAVWNVGGASTATRRPWLGIVNSQNGFSGGDVTALMHFARYEFDHVGSSSEETEMIMSRLAAAMDMDLAHRQLIIPKPVTSTEYRFYPSSAVFGKSVPFPWEDCAWMRAESTIPGKQGNPRKDDIDLLTRTIQGARGSQNQKRQSISSAPFCVLWTPYIIDDYYRSVLAYCRISGLIAFAELGIICLWSTINCKYVGEIAVGWPIHDQVTALTFSSSSGCESILVAGTERGQLHLWKTLELREIFAWRFNNKVTCVAFKPTTSWCRSAVFPGVDVPVEHLAVGDELGTVWYYAIEINSFDALSKVTLLARIDAHTACLCSITWSPDNRFLATGGDDNVCLLFEMKHILQNQQSSNTPMDSPLTNGRFSRLRHPQDPLSAIVSRFARMLGDRSRLGSTYLRSRSQPLPDSISDTSSIPGRVRSASMSYEEAQANIAYQRVRNSVLNTSSGPQSRGITRSQPFRRVVSAYYYPRPERYTQNATWLTHGKHIHHFEHGSAIKAVAFAPWQPTLLATGGGNGDRTVHFYHATTGSCLAKIYMWAQVTGLVWSKTRREILVILGDPEYEHPYRVVVFAWPSCEQITAIPFNIDKDGQSFPHFTQVERALSVISIPNFIDPMFESPGDFGSDLADECIAIASPRCIRCYRIWRKIPKVSPDVMPRGSLDAFDDIENARNEIIR